MFWFIVAVYLYFVGGLAFIMMDESITKNLNWKTATLICWWPIILPIASVVGLVKILLDRD